MALLCSALLCCAMRRCAPLCDQRRATCGGGGGGQSGTPLRARKGLSPQTRPPRGAKKTTRVLVCQQRHSAAAAVVVVVVVGADFRFGSALPRADALYFGPFAVGFIHIRSLAAATAMAPPRIGSVAERERERAMRRTAQPSNFGGGGGAAALTLALQ